jgi:hypothetical protein
LGHDPRPYEFLHDDPELMQIVSRRLREHLQDLMQACNAVAGPAGCHWLTVAEAKLRWPGLALGYDHRDEGTLLLTGDAPTFLSGDETFDDCPYHHWEKCQRVGRAATAQPIGTPSFDPASFFTTGSVNHCAHNAVWTLKQGRCLLPRDRYVCCRQCAFFSHCWQDQAQALPCVAAPTRLSGDPEDA